MLFRLSEVRPPREDALLSQLFIRELQRCSPLPPALEAVSKVQYRSGPSGLFHVSKRRVIVPPSWKYFQGRRADCVRMYVCIARKKRERGERNGSSHGARRESMWQSAVDTLVMALGGVTRLAMLSGVSPLMKVVTSRGPHLLKPRLPRRIQGYRCQHQQQRLAGSSDAEPPCCKPVLRPGLHRTPLLPDAILRSFFVLRLARVNLPVYSRSILKYPANVFKSRARVVDCTYIVL